MATTALDLLACQHGVVGFATCNDCNTLYAARLFECQIYGSHTWHVVSYSDGDTGLETFTCTHCEWEKEVRYY